MKSERIDAARIRHIACGGNCQTEILKVNSDTDRRLRGDAGCACGQSLGVLWPRTPEDQDLANPMNRRGVHLFGERVPERAALVTVVHGDADFYQLVRRERAVHFGHERRCNSCMAHPHDRLQRMRAGLQAGALLRRKRNRHAAIVATTPTAPAKPPMR